MVAGEALARLLLNPVDYLAVDPVADSVLGTRLEPGAGGHDAWGFRNRDVPAQADVVTIGDSQTYGISAPAKLSWPAQLGDRLGRRVYNLALGGYGPVQYLELLRTRALRLRPKVVVVGVYYGNDLYDAYRVVYGSEHWSPLRRAGVPRTAASDAIAAPREVFLGTGRDWLARHSVIYRLLTFSALGSLARRLEFTGAETTIDAVAFRHPVHGAFTGFTPGLRLQTVDLADAPVREGLRLTLDRLERMAATCRDAGVHIVVALIPTKETVYAPWVIDSADRARLSPLWRSEREVDRAVRVHLDRRGIPHVTLLDSLRKAASRQAIYPSNDDGHPNGAGYAAIAGAVAAALQGPLAAADPGALLR